MRAAKIPLPAGIYRQSHRDRGHDAPALFVRKARDCAVDRAAQPRSTPQQKVLSVQLRASRDLMDGFADLPVGCATSALAPRPLLPLPLSADTPRLLSS